MSNRERRSLIDSPITANEEGKFTGLAAVFDRPSEDLGGFIEYIDKRAFDNVLAENPDVVAVWNHNENELLGRTKSGTLKLWTTEQGLHYELDAPDTSLGRDLRELASRGDVTSSSFAFTVEKQEWEKRDGKKVRRITQIGRLFDVSLVTVPAYPDATVALRSLEQFEVEQSNESFDKALSIVLRRSVATSKAALACADAEIKRTPGSE